MRPKHFFHEFGMPPSIEGDIDEVHYWRGVRERLSLNSGLGRLSPMRRESPKRTEEVTGFNRKQLEEYLKDLHPNLRHGSDDILNALEKKEILEPIDYYCELVSPEKATDIFTTDIPEIIDNALSLEKITKWLIDDVKKAIDDLSKKQSGDSDRKEAIDWAKEITETYRKGLKSLRRRIKARLKEIELEKEIEKYREFGLSIQIEELFDDQGLINALELVDIQYLFQLIKKSRLEIKNLEGIGQLRLQKIDQMLASRGLKFYGKGPEKTRKRKSKGLIKAQVVNA